MEEKNIGMTIVSIVLVVVSVLMLIPTAFLVYFKTWGKDKVPTAVQSTYVTTVKDKISGEEKPFIQAKYYANATKNGKEVIEILFNSYSDGNAQTVYGRGFQLVFDQDGNVYPYDSYNGNSWITGHEYQWGDPFYVDIDGNMYAVKLDGTYITSNFDYFKGVRNLYTKIFTLGFKGNRIADKSSWYSDEIHEYTFKDLLLFMKRMILSLADETGTTILPVSDLASYLNVYPIDKNGNISNQKIDRADFSNSYFTIQCSYDKRGLVSARQSLFGAVNGDSSYNESGVEFDLDYWKASNSYILALNDWAKRESKAEVGVYLSLNSIMKKYLANADVELDITINLDKFKENVLGLDLGALKGYNIKSLTITSSVTKDFVILEEALEDTGLKTITARNVNVTIEENNTGVIVK